MSISINHLSIGYPDHVVQSELSLTLQTGEVVAMLGPNGCGKSTLLRTLAGLQPPLSGSFTFADASQPSKAVALVLTHAEGLEHISIHDVVAMGRYPYTSFMGTLTPYDENIILNAMTAVGFEVSNSFMEKPFACCSDGEKQRILIAKALTQQTPVILLDEPTAHLDLPNRIRTFQLLQTLAHTESKTVLISTHELDLALQMADRILLMSPAQGGVQLHAPVTLLHSDILHQTFHMDILSYLPLAFVRN